MGDVVTGQKVMLEVEISRRVYFTIKRHCKVHQVSLAGAVESALWKVLEDARVPLLEDDLIPPRVQRGPYRLRVNV